MTRKFRLTLVAVVLALASDPISALDSVFAGRATFPDGEPAEDVIVEAIEGKFAGPEKAAVAKTGPDGSWQFPLGTERPDHIFAYTEDYRWRAVVQMQDFTHQYGTIPGYMGPTDAIPLAMGPLLHTRYCSLGRDGQMERWLEMLTGMLNRILQADGRRSAGLRPPNAYLEAGLLDENEMFDFGRLHRLAVADPPVLTRRELRRSRKIVARSSEARILWGLQELVVTGLNAPIRFQEPTAMDCSSSDGHVYYDGVPMWLEHEFDLPGGYTSRGQ